MDNKQDKFSNADDYDLILEEKEKELKKEKRNKIILASSLALLLLLGSTAAVAPIISVAVNNKNIHNSSNSNGTNDSTTDGSNNSGSNGSNNGGSIDIPANIPNQLAFTDSDITTLINGYQDEIKLRKLVYDQFQNDFINITRKHITASNIRIGSLVKNATIQKVVNNNQTNFNISITLDDNNREYFYMDLTKAQLNKNVLSFTLTENIDLTFSTIIKVTVDQLNKIKDEIQKYVDKYKIPLNRISNLDNNNYFLKDIIEAELNTRNIDLENTKYEWSKLTIIPQFPYAFECDSVSDMIVDGNIVISSLTSDYKWLVFHNLQDVYDLINDSVCFYTVDEVKLYLKNNQENFKQFLVDNLVIENNDNDFTIDTITDITFDEKYSKIIVNFIISNSDYVSIRSNRSENGNLVSIAYGDNIGEKYYMSFKCLDIDLSGSPLNWFTYNKSTYGYTITGLTELGKQQSSFQFNKRMKYFAEGAFSDCDNIVTMDFSLIEQETNFILNLSKDLFNNCKNLQNVILPNCDYKIGDSAFKDCSKLQTTDLLSNASEIDDYAFYNCTSLSSPNVITISKTSKIGNYAFANCTGLKKVDAKGNCKQIGNNAFENSGLIWFKGNANGFSYVIDGATHKDVIFLDSTYSLGYDVFKNCANLQWVEFKGGYKWSRAPFSGCNGITYYTAVGRTWTFPPQVGKPSIDGHYIRDIYSKQDQTGISQFLTSSAPE